VELYTSEERYVTGESPDIEVLSTFDQVPVSDAERVTILEAARCLFGFAALRPGQVETIAPVLRGEDVLAILPTGGGKSLCYYLPALLAESGVTLVISPLIALMKDQVDSLPDHLRERAVTINSALEAGEVRRRLEQVAAGGYRLVYAAPERLRQPPFLHTLRRAGVNRLVIDEAHCLSVWGHDFRPDYLYIGAAREALGRPPLLALTATAPPRVRRDIVQHLGALRVLAGDVTRPNLRLSVFYAANTDDKRRYLLAFCRTYTRAGKGSGIVYAGTRARCESLAALLRQEGMDAVHYHARMDDRAQVQDDFMAGRADIVVATVAFGMGIDKPDTRFIVHFAPPASLEAYAQEAGRAGRDGLPAECLLMCTAADRATLAERAGQELLPVEFLRRVYAAVRRRLRDQPWGTMAAADLETELSAEGTSVRVALSLLEEAGLLRRGADLPRRATARLTATLPDDAPEGLADFCRAAFLKPGQTRALDLCTVARDLALTPDELEPRLLAWADAGWLTYAPTGRDLSLTLRQPPADAPERVAALLERHATLQTQRVDEIVAYAQTEGCRHGYLNAYLGGRATARCDVCDNCGIRAPVLAESLPDAREQFVCILRALAETRGLGRTALARLLHGDARTADRARDNSCFGALAFRSKAALMQMIDLLVDDGLVSARTLNNGGVVFEITSAGRYARRNPALLDDLLAKQQRVLRHATLDEPAPEDPDPPKPTVRTILGNILHYAKTIVE